SRISKSIPFSNNTKRHRWLKGQVVPEYRTIMRKLLSKRIHSQKKYRGESAVNSPRKGVARKSANVFPECPVEQPCGHEQYAEVEQHPDAELGPLQGGRIGHVGEVGDQVGNVLVELRP